MPVIITIAVTGLKDGRGANISLLTIVSATITAISTTSLVLVLDFSKFSKKGILQSTAIIIDSTAQSPKLSVWE